MGPFLLVRCNLQDRSKEVPALGGILTLEPLEDQRPDLIEDPRILSIAGDSPVQFTKVAEQIDKVCLLKMGKDAIRIPL